MADHVSIEVDDRAAQAMLDRVENVARNLPMNAVADKLYTLVRNTYRSERDPWGRPWPPLSPLTLKARRRRKIVGQQKLISTGRLWASIQSDYTDADAIVTAGEGLPDPRAVVNQFGATDAGRSRSVRIPARPFFPMRAEGVEEIPEPWWPTLRLPIEKELEKAAA